MTTITLSKPVEAHGERLAVLTLREPTGKDITAAGMPLRFAGAGDAMQAEIDAAPMSRMIARLAGVPPSAVDALSASDWMEAATGVLLFFAPAPKS